MAADTMSTVVTKVDGLRLADLHDELAGPVSELQDKVGTLDGLVTTARRATTLLPVMLGSDGPRTYLVMALNSAELRAPGGIPGAFVVIGTEAGQITMLDQAATQDVGPSRVASAPGPCRRGALRRRHGRPRPGHRVHPDFPTAASLAAAMWESSQGQAVDGVVTIDPVALSYLLEATGPVEVAGTTIDAGNAVSTLLSDAYAELEPGPETDAFFAAVAARVLDSALSGATDPQTLLSGVQRAASEHRTLLWSSHDDEQALLADTVVSGDIGTSDRAEDTVGVFFNDATAGR
ncbi:DUF4012 domain-containing protein [Oerskovia sp. M15]